MKKRLPAALVCVLLVLSLLPKTALAEDYTTDFSSTNYVDWNNKLVNYCTDDDRGSGWSWSAVDKILTPTEFHFTTSAAIALILPAGTTLV